MIVFVVVVLHLSEGVGCIARVVTVHVRGDVVQHEATGHHPVLQAQFNYRGITQIYFKHIPLEEEGGGSCLKVASPRIAITAWHKKSLESLDGNTYI